MQGHTTHGYVRHMVIVTVAMALAVVGLVVAGDRLLTDSKRAEAQTNSRPNFVFVMTDDLDEQSMQQLGGIRDIMRTNGTTFKNAYVTYSLCCPSRTTILRGQYPHNHGILGNLLPLGGEAKFRELGLDRSTVATWLNDAGYQTKYIGKYMNGYKDLHKPPGWDEWFVLQGDVNNNQVNDNGTSVTLTGHSTDVFAQEASDFITRSSATPEPLFVLVGTKAPHRPPEVANRYKDQFAATPLPRSDNFNEADVSDKAQWLRAYPKLSQAEIDDTQTLYRERLRSMLSVEDLLRQTISTLQQTGELHNTYIFFTSDNGFHLGNHRLSRGKRTSYEEDIGVPLMVRGPGVPAGALRQELVLNNDFAPTIADLADASTPAFVDGSSFAPLLTGSPPTSWRAAFLEEGTLETIGTETPTPTHKSVHTRQHVFVEYAETAEHELYDLSTDPYQLQSKTRADNEQLFSELQAQLNALRNCSGTGCRAAEWDTRVISTVPKAGATGVAPSANLTATFSEKMMASSINTTTFKLFKVNLDGSTTQVTNVTVTPSTDGLKATLDPFGTSSILLEKRIKYMGVVTTEARDVAGNQLDQNTTTAGLQQKAWYFTVSK
jgi:N-acetylglucosamine-6-sulfatase